MRSSAVTAGNAANASEYNNLRQDAKGAGTLLVHEQASPDMTVAVEAGIAFLNGKKIIYAGGNSGTITAPSVNPRIDLLLMSGAGALSLVTGTEAGSPTAPTYPANYLVLAEIYLRTTATTIRDADTAGQGYIYRDSRPFMADYNLPRIGFAFNMKDGTPWTASTFGSGTPVATFGSNGKLLMETGTTASGTNAVARFLDTTAANVHNLFDYDPDFYALLMPATNLGAGQTKRFFAVFGYQASSDAVVTLKHFGFEIRCNDGAEEMYATWADGSTHGEQLLSGVTVTVNTVYRCYAKLYSGSRAEFYVDGVLQHTATANLPTGSITTSGSDGNICGFGIYSTVGTTTWQCYVLATSFGWSPI